MAKKFGIIIKKMQWKFPIEIIKIFLFLIVSSL